MTRTKKGTRCPGTRWFCATSPGTRIVPCWLFGACISRSPKQNRSDLCLACRNNRSKQDKKKDNFTCIKFSIGLLWWLFGFKKKSVVKYPSHKANSWIDRQMTNQNFQMNRHVPWKKGCNQALAEGKESKESKSALSVVSKVFGAKTWTFTYLVGESPRVCSKYSNWNYLLCIWGGAKVSSIANELTFAHDGQRALREVMETIIDVNPRVL